MLIFYIRINITEEDTIKKSSSETDTTSASSETIMDRIVRCEREEYARLINDGTQIHFDPSPEASDNVEPSNDNDSSKGPKYTELVAEQTAFRRSTKRAHMLEPQRNRRMALSKRARMLEQQRNRRMAHLLALGMSGFSLTGYMV